MGRLSDDLGKAVRGGPALQAALVRAVGELALARIVHALTPVRRLPLRPAPAAPAELTPAQRAVLQRVTYVVPRMGRRVPWRSDCLIQALAARRWLARHGIATSLHIGTSKTEEKGFEAHAWLTVVDSAGGESVVTGWDIAGFADFAAFPPSAGGAPGGD